jgi:hypothetical protein
VSLLLQQLLVGVVVLGCVLFSFWRLASHRTRLATLARVERLPGLSGNRIIEKLRRETLARQAGACGACAQGSATPSAASRNRTPGALRR